MELEKKQVLKKLFKNKNIILYFLLIIITFLLIISYQDTHLEGEHNKNFSFIYVTDPPYPTTERKINLIFSDALKMEQYDVDFIVYGGDQVALDRKTVKEAREQYELLLKVYETFSKPVYTIMGNHDILRLKNRKHQKYPNGLFREYIGNPFWSFDIGTYHILGLSTIYSDPIERKYIYQLTKKDKEWLINDLERTDKENMIIFAPENPEISDTLWYKKVKHLLLDMNVRIYAGHEHSLYLTKTSDEIPVVVGGASCGNKEPINYDRSLRPRGFLKVNVKGGIIEERFIALDQEGEAPMVELLDVDYKGKTILGIYFSEVINKVFVNGVEATKSKIYGVYYVPYQNKSTLDIRVDEKFIQLDVTPLNKKGWFVLEGKCNNGKLVRCEGEYFLAMSNKGGHFNKDYYFNSISYPKEAEYVLYDYNFVKEINYKLKIESGKAGIFIGWLYPRGDGFYSFILNPSTKKFEVYNHRRWAKTKKSLIDKISIPWLAYNETFDIKVSREKSEVTVYLNNNIIYQGSDMINHTIGYAGLIGYNVKFSIDPSSYDEKTERITIK